MNIPIRLQTDSVDEDLAFAGQALAAADFGWAYELLVDLCTRKAGMTGAQRIELDRLGRELEKALDE